MEGPLGFNSDLATNSFEEHSLHWCQVPEEVLVLGHGGRGADISTNWDGVSIKSGWAWLSVTIGERKDIGVAVEEVIAVLPGWMPSWNGNAEANVLAKLMAEVLKALKSWFM